MSKEELCVHMLYLRSTLLELEAAEADAKSKSSGGKDDPTKILTEPKVQGSTAWSCTAPAKPDSNKDFCPPAFKSDAVWYWYWFCPSTSTSTQLVLLGPSLSLGPSYPLPTSFDFYHYFAQRKTYWHGIFS
jgi:hypothetical protein